MSNNNVRLVSQQTIANFLGVTPRTVRNMITRGDLTAYRVPGLRAVRLDLNEVKALVQRVPTVSKRGRQIFGPNARVVDAPPSAAIVPDAAEPARRVQRPDPRWVAAGRARAAAAASTTTEEQGR